MLSLFLRLSSSSWPVLFLHFGITWSDDATSLTQRKWGIGCPSDRLCPKQRDFSQSCRWAQHLSLPPFHLFSFSDTSRSPGDARSAAIDWRNASLILSRSDRIRLLRNYWSVQLWRRAGKACAPNFPRYSPGRPDVWRASSITPPRCPSLTLPLPKLHSERD